jgi:DNA-binding IclR family transcriptional regulator
MKHDESHVARPEGSQSISRAVELLTAVANCGESGASLSQIAGQTELHVATARRIMQALVVDGLLAFDFDTKRYSMGPAIFSFAVMGNPWFLRRDMFNGALEEIARHTGDTAMFSIRSGTEAVCLARREGNFPIRVMSLDAGSRRPLGAGSGSAAILAFLPDEERRTIIEHNAGAYAAFGITVDDVRQMTEEARANGFSVNDGRIIDGVYGVGVPVLMGDVAVASISVAAIASRMQAPRRVDIVRTICTALQRFPGIQLPQLGQPNANSKKKARKA